MGWWRAVAVVSMLIPVFLLGPGAEREGLGSQSDGDDAESDSLLTHRTRGCAICETMAQNSPAGRFSDDPHTFACARCHHPHTKKAADAWRNTCMSSGCHPRAWTRTVFHRLDPDIFLDCTNCHQAHTWSLNGYECGTCHDPPAGETAVVFHEKSVDFSHEPHEGLDCGECHVSLVKHGVAASRSFEPCAACHHGSSPVVECSKCHGNREIAGPRDVNLTVQLTVWDAPRTKHLRFDHARHKSLDCERCHGETASPADVDCTSCHGNHHRAFETRCWSCHGEPPAGVHPRRVHEGGCSGSGCHSREDVEQVTWTRNLCQACHRDRFDHNPGDNCADCHLPLD